MKSTNRLVVKIAGESGQGINSIGEVVARALKETGFYSFGYREYPSVIKGGHAFHQTDFSDAPINSPSRSANILLCFSRVSFHAYLPTLNDGGQVIHMIPQLVLTKEEEELAKEKNICIKYIDAEAIAKTVGATSIMANSVLVGSLWKLMNLPLDPLAHVIKAQFAHKPKYVQPNIDSLRKGFETDLEGLSVLKINFSRHPERKKDALLTGNHLISLSAVAAGVRSYFAYPMTPSSSILSYMADIYKETGMLVKQLDDEIAVAQVAMGAMFMGTRALIATSGGGFDLMTESVSLSGVTETPFVCILAQRPGPATGMPTWTSAGDLNLAIYAGHGEFPRCVISVSDSKSAYTLVQKSFNLAEKYQIPVILLTDKEIAESLFQLENLEPDLPIERGLVKGEALESLKSDDRYKITESGISPRWLPGDAEITYVGNSDEHLEDGTVTEDATASLSMNQKRMRKLQTLKAELPEPELIGPTKATLTLIGWGSVKNTVVDVMSLWNMQNSGKLINYLHYEYMYPTKVEKLKKLITQGQNLLPIENNAMGQLTSQLTQETGHIFTEKLLKFDGRPFFIEDVLEYLEGKFKK